ncbi:hypothetical protein [Methylophaga sp. OBS3]|nr:hypothetical protein [Methylophaga sp. OBS3]MCX4190698.1 hypothetical protein [Methylophaga sp. OBS3]
MSDFIPANEFEESTLQDRVELFRYTDLTHPLMQVLFNFQLTKSAPPETD